jgi:hypothetical protein
VRGPRPASFTHRVPIAFPEVDEVEIAQVDVRASKEPVVVRLSDKNGQVVERFYVRSGNSSQEVPLSELHQHWRDRFPEPD